jgi:hypothetical protein
MLPRETIAEFDAHLHACGLALEAVVIGGAALALLGVTDRQTRDVDVLHPDLPEPVLEAAKAFAASQRKAGSHLADGWLNNGPAQLREILPAGWEQRLQPAFSGNALTLHAPGRDDLLKTKLFALCDRGTDLPDCIALAPTRRELLEAQAWVALQDTNPGWPAHVRRTLDDLRGRLGHGL